MNLIKRQIRYYQFEAINKKDGRFNDMDQGVAIVDDVDYTSILYYTESINKNNPIRDKQRKFMSHNELINKYEIGFILDD